MFAMVWWMYDGYAWLTNAISTDRVRYRLLLIGGMGGFLVIALAIPHAYEGDGLPFGLGFLVVVLLHGSMYVKGTSVAEVAAILRVVPFNLAAAALLLVGGRSAVTSSGSPGRSRRPCSGSRPGSRASRAS